MEHGSEWLLEHSLSITDDAPRHSQVWLLACSTYPPPFGHWTHPSNCILLKESQIQHYRACNIALPVAETHLPVCVVPTAPPSLPAAGTASCLSELPSGSTGRPSSSLPRAAPSTPSPAATSSNALQAAPAYRAAGRAAPTCGGRHSSGPGTCSEGPSVRHGPHQPDGDTGLQQPRGHIQ